ncbi:hypothetical protein U1872_22340, partial [Sphingomonas sp. RB3P16]|uniref:hypothetical protein n=1 Tax=Parasphingomonas frigoris TaxID=3096163 RepID=UPI002FC5CC1B
QLLAKTPENRGLLSALVIGIKTPKSTHLRYQRDTRMRHTSTPLRLAVPSSEPAKRRSPL